MVYFLSILNLRSLNRILSLIYVLSCVGFSCWDLRVASGFEVPSRYNAPKRTNVSTSAQYDTLSGIEVPQSSKSSSLHRKYDLGLGKNGPLQTNGESHCIDRQILEEQERLDPNSVRATTLDDNHSTCVTTYEACRFLVEHEATRIYPAPNENTIAEFAAMDSEDKIHANRPFQTTATSSTSILSSASTSTSARDPAEKKVPSKRTTHKRTRKPQYPVKVKPKRLLEDCLTILDRKMLSDSSTAAASTNSIIWSRPDTPQLDMNSVWVEMMLHNQMALSRTQG